MKMILPNFILVSKLQGFGGILCILLIFFTSCQQDSPSNAESKLEKIDAIIAEDYARPPYRMGFLNTSFEEVIPAQYDEVRHFSEGFAAVNVKGFWGFIDTMGKAMVPPRFLGCWSFSSGLAKVQSAQNRKLGFIDMRGDTIIPIEYDEARTAAHELIPLKKGQYWGLKNLSDKTVVPFEYYDLKILNPQTVALKVTDLWMITDWLKKDTLATDLQAVYESTDGVYRVKSENGAYRYLDSMGQPIFSQGAQLAYAPQDGIYVRCLSQKECQLYDREGRPLSEVYERVRPLGMGRFGYYQNEKWGMMDELGAIILPPQFDQLYGFSAGYAPFLKDKLWGFVGLNGKRAVNNIYGLAWPFQNGYARVLSRTGMSFLDKRLQLHPIPDGISDVRSFSQGRAAFKRPVE